VEFIWDDEDDQEGNLYHVLRHTEMKDARFIEAVFSTMSGDEAVWTAQRGGETFYVMEKTYKRYLYKIVFQSVGNCIRIKTAHRISKRSK